MTFMSSTQSRIVHLTPYTPIANGAIQSLQVQVDGTLDTLRLHYTLTGNLSRIRIPQPRPPRRTDELWKHTCFEAFLRASAGTAYHEINVAPSGEWALYSFDDYRKGMRPADVPHPPHILVAQTADRLSIEVQLALKMLPPSRALALAAVIEDDGGSLSYWALKHPASKPDFHHRDGFVLEI